MAPNRLIFSTLNHYVMLKTSSLAIVFLLINIIIILVSLLHKVIFMTTVMLNIAQAIDRSVLIISRSARVE